MHGPGLPRGMTRIEGPSRENREKAERIEAKKERGETLTREEAGHLGAMGAMRKGAAEQREARREGRAEEYEEAHRTASWMKGEATRGPELSRDAEREVARIEAKQEHGETLTRSEAGTLGGAARAKKE